MFSNLLSSAIFGLVILLSPLNTNAQSQASIGKKPKEEKSPKFSYHRMRLLPMASSPGKVKPNLEQREIPNMMVPTPNPVIQGNPQTEPGGTTIQPPVNEAEANKISGIPVQVGRNFEGNHLFRGVPTDNAIAISDGGTIVSIDNGSIAYFNEDGDSAVQFGLPHPAVFGSQAGLNNGNIYDPRVIYDRNADRFISAMLFISPDHSDSRLLVSFSLPLLSDSVSWYHFSFECDSLFTDPADSMLWFDYPYIGINDDELFVTLNTFERNPGTGGDSFRGNVILQIDKTTAFNGVPNSVYRIWEDVENTENDLLTQPMPLSDAFQSDDYDSSFYFVGNYRKDQDHFFWWELKGDLNDPNADIVKHGISTSIPYSVSAYVSQSGGLGTDRIQFRSNKVQSGFFQNGKLHFVYHNNDNGWAEIVYANIDIANNSMTTHSFGGDGTNMNYMFPSIAPFGADSSKENYMIAFQRTGPGIFPELCVVNFENGWSPATTVVRQGDGILDLISDLVSPWDSLERFGDYTDIQRKYNSPTNACWLAGAYPIGNNPNHFGVVSGLNTWIAEVGDSSVTSRSSVMGNQNIRLYPNPVHQGGEIKIEVPLFAVNGIVEIMDMNGKGMLFASFSGKSFTLSNILLPPSVYLIRVSDEKTEYGSKKILILP